ncbi:MAG: ABC transporter substrate-binding protein [Nocardioidaceae bacterium]
MRLTRVLVAVAVPALLAATACAPSNNSASTTAASSSPSAGGCAKKSLALKTPGQLTIATSSPAYPPWFANNDPTNGKGYESAVAYAVAKQLGFTPAQVKWVKEPFNNSYAPGTKNFDFDINQISILPARAKVVDFSNGYYTAAQGVIAMKGTPAAKATSIAGLKGLKLGAQTGTTSLTAIRQVIKPTAEPLVFTDTNAAKQALTNGQVDAILADLPTAFIITAAEIPHSTIVGQIQAIPGEPEQFGMLFQKGSALVPCVNQALAKVKSAGVLAALQKRWVSDVAGVPVLK